MAPLGSGRGAGLLLHQPLPRVLRPGQVARHLGVSRSWVHRAMLPPDRRPGGRCRGIPQIPSIRHPAGGRGVRADQYLAWLSEVCPEALPEGIR